MGDHETGASDRWLNSATIRELDRDLAADLDVRIGAVAVAPVVLAVSAGDRADRAGRADATDRIATPAPICTRT
jgi:hypothetical protein